MLINFDTLIPEALALQGEEWKKFFNALISNNVPIRCGVRKRYGIFESECEYKIKFSVNNWGKYIKEVK